MFRMKISVLLSPGFLAEEPPPPEPEPRPPLRHH